MTTSCYPTPIVFESGGAGWEAGGLNWWGWGGGDETPQKLKTEKRGNGKYFTSSNSPDILG